MGALIEKIRSFSFKGIFFVLFIFLVITAILIVELSGVNAILHSRYPELLPTEKTLTKAEVCATLSKDVLLLRDSSDVISETAYEEFAVILDDMKIGYEDIDLASESAPPVGYFKAVIVLLADLTPMGKKGTELVRYVHNGGKAFFPLTLETTPNSSAIMQMLGVDDIGPSYYAVESIYLHEGFMVGGGKAFAINDAFECAMTVVLRKDVEVFASAESASGVPLVWRTSYGDGTFVVANIGIYEKAMRGFYAAAYSLLEDVCAYPVVNGSVFYLDDFPSQIPEGYSEYIMRDYQSTTREFYTNIWWPDMLNFGDRYGVKYTGLAIESYDDNVDGTTDAKPDTGTFTNFGNMLLRKGGELGYHGYNHQPLVINGDYLGLYTYKTWQSEWAMKSAFDSLVGLCSTLFPDTQFAVYVPPSNLMGDEGRAFLLKNYPQIRTISGIYFDDAEYDGLDFACMQEFDVDENGIVDQPRIISGFILDNFQNIAAVSELNMRYINSHFTHPDDALDEERGAALGWEEMKRRFDGFLSWLYTSAPGLRNLTGTEVSGAVQRYIAIAPKTETFDDRVEITIENFYDEAFLLVRFNEKTPGSVKGGTLTHVTGDLYLLSATRGFVEITLN